MASDAGGLLGGVSLEGLEAEVVSRSPLAIRVSGELDVVTAPAVADLLASISGSGASEVQIDAAGLSFVDSQGLNVLMQARRRGLRLRLSSASPQLLRVLDLGGLAELFPLDPA